ncbi:MAG TPA: hypothetical protein VM598_07220, partial [Bdellovibrionota bacterium]|nr:hypothetical protein [Bdellovibrionota bacterium]
LPIVLTPGSVWRGYFDPTDVDGWFASYTKWLEGVAQDAIELGSTELVVGSEFKPIYRHTEHWRRLLRHMRGVFPGPLIVTANWDEFDYGFWDEADAIGVSAYFPLSIVPNPTQEMLDRGWQGHRERLKKVADKWKRPLHMTEVGYSSSSTTAATPWTIGEGAVPDAPLQARCFMAFAKAWVDQPWMVRATVWSTGDPAGDHSMSGDPLGKPAEAILRAFFQARSTR